MTKKYYGLQVHTLTFLKVDENGESIDGKQYEYTGDHSGFCDGIEEDYLEEVEKPFYPYDQKNFQPSDLYKSLALARGQWI